MGDRLGTRRHFVIDSNETGPREIFAILLPRREHRSLNKQIEFLLERCTREKDSSETVELERVSSARGKRK
jgi:hypothetical protein